jgi:feruloyl esterase
VMTLAAKEIAAAYYGAQIQHSYWNGCSEGGNQGLSEAQRYPADYDGIVAGAPASDFTHLQMGGLWISHAIHKDPASFIAGPQLATLNRAVLAACDATDGVRDGIVTDPTRCTFDPKSLQCKGGATDDCLTHAQIEGIRKIYEGALNPRTHQSIFPGYQRGGELGWESWIAGTNVPPVNRQHLIQNAFFTYIAFENADWEWTGFDFDSQAAEVDRKLAAIVNNTDPDLTAFKKRGGKLLQYHGWYDPAISPLASMRYFERVEASIGDPREFYRLFMVPGMGHCGGGPGADQFDKLSLLKAWVEEGKAPDSIVATRSEAAKPRARLLCPYPQIAMWTREGDGESAEQYRCVAPASSK